MEAGPSFKEPRGPAQPVTAIRRKSASRTQQRERFAIIDIDDPSGMPVGADDVPAIEAALPVGATSDDGPRMWDAPTRRSIDRVHCRRAR
jgi:hypothetical protein